MEVQGKQPPYPDLSDNDRVGLLDSLVLPPLLAAGRPVLDVEELPGYRSYILKSHTPQDQQVYDYVAKAARLLQKGYKRFAQSYIAEHPEILNYASKIHLQPQPADIPQAVSSLVALLSEEGGVADKISGFKINTRGVYLKFESDQPYVVVYLQKGTSLEEIVPFFVKEFADFEQTSRPLRFNQKYGPIVYGAFGDGRFKQMYLDRFGLLDEYYDQATNHSFPRSDIPKPKESFAERIVRRTVERLIKT